MVDWEKVVEDYGGISRDKVLCRYLLDNGLVKLYDTINVGYTGLILQNKRKAFGENNICPTLTTHSGEIAIVIYDDPGEDVK